MASPTSLSEPLNTTARALRVTWFWVFVAVCLRVAHVSVASLHLDDFHTLHHASASSWSVFFETLRSDNHPPLVPALVRVLTLALPDPVLPWRLLQVVFAAVLVVQTGRIAELLSGTRARWIAEALVACSSLHVELSTDLRMYGLLALLGLLLFGQAIKAVERVGNPLDLALIVALGLHTHYHFLHALAGTVGVIMILRFARRIDSPSTVRFGLGVCGGVLLWLPWGAWGFWHQVFGHALAPGTSHVDPARVVQGLVHLTFHRTALLGETSVAALTPLAALALALGLLGVVRLIATRSTTASGVLLGWFTFGLVAWSALAAQLSARAGFEFRYLAVAIGPFALALAHGLSHGWPWKPLRRLVPVALVGASFAVSLALALDHGRENYKAAVHDVLTRANTNDGVLAADWQPRIFPRSIGWRWYAPRLAAPTQAMPHSIDYTPDFALTDEDAVLERERVFVITRSVPGNAPLFEQLAASHQRMSAERFGQAIWVVEYRRHGVAQLDQGR